MADIGKLAQVFYDRAKGDAVLTAALKTHYDTLADAIMSGATSGTIVTGGKNGVNYTTRIDTSTTDRLNAMNLALRGLDTGIRPSRTYHARFC
jgi:hypothetical protein